MLRRDFLSLAAAMAPEAEPRGGNGTLLLGAYPRRMFVIDEASEKVTGEIPFSKGTPRGVTLSSDKKRLYTVTDNFEDCEVVDIPSRRVVDTFRAGEGNQHMRTRNIAVDPQQDYAVFASRTATKQLDRWEISPNTIYQYDLKAKKIMRTIPWPKGEEREFAAFKFSPDGKNLFLFGDDIVVMDTKDFKEVDKWELSRPLEDGFGRINFNSLDDHYEEPGYFTGIFNVEDAVQHRRIMGIARVNLQRKSVDFYALGPAQPVNFTMSPDRKFGYGLRQEIGRYEFWTFDLVSRRVASRTEFPGRPRMGIKTSSNGKLLYIYVAGNTIDVHDAAGYRRLRTITLDGDMTSELIVLPKT